jgi:hypothetical protein
MEIINNIRVDKNLAYNILDFRKIDDYQTRSILKSLLLYFSFQYEKDLFGYGKLDPILFAKMFNHDRANLSRHIKEPKYISDNISSSTKWDTYLENALYILATTPIFEEYKGQDDNFNIVGFRNYIILKDVSVFTPIKNRGKEKKYYRYALDNSFELNLKKFFLNINVKYYLETRKWNGDDFYLQIMNIYNQSKRDGKTSFYWEINVLLDYFNVAHKEIRVQKQRLNAIFKKYEELLKNDIQGLSFVWRKTGAQKFAYTLYMIWEKEDPKQMEQEKIKTLEELFLDTLKRELYNVYNAKKQSKKENLEEFYNWLINKKNKEAILSTHKLVTNNLKGKNNWGADGWALAFYNKMSVIRDIKLMNKCFTIE